MKTHKTASSTLLNILFRFGQKHGLKFAFPNGRNDFDYPAFFARSLVQDYRPGACFNIICNHMRFHYDEVRGLVAPNATFITVLRDPARLFMPMTFVYSPCSDSTASFIEKASTSSLLSQIPILLQTGIGPDAGKKNTIKKDPGLPSRGPQIGKDYVLFIFLLLNHDTR